MSNPHEPKLPPEGQFLVYRAEDGQIKIDVRLEGETAWLTQAQMAELFQTTIPNVNMHLRNVYAEGELQAAATIKEFLIVRQEGSRQVKRQVDFPEYLTGGGIAAGGNSQGILVSSPSSTWQTSFRRANKTSVSTFKTSSKRGNWQNIQSSRIP